MYIPEWLLGIGLIIWLQRQPKEVETQVITACCGLLLYGLVKAFGLVPVAMIGFEVGLCVLVGWVLIFGWDDLIKRLGIRARQ